MKPVFSNFVGVHAHPIDSDHDLWQSALPKDRFAAALNPKASKSAGFRYADYFSAAHEFLTANNFQNLLGSLNQVFERDVTLSEITSVNIKLLKHGKYYHPAKIEVRLEQTEYAFVLNLAVSPAGLSTIETEYKQLRRLDTEFPISFIPKVFASGDVTQPDGSPVKMFLGQWLDGYHEFHLSPKLPAGIKTDRLEIKVWNETEDRLSGDRILDLIQNASMILSFYYNPETFEQIFPWHHAAGDFVVRLKGDRLSLKLITVRDYAPLLTDNSQTSDSTDLIAMLQSLLLFCIALSLRMRMDRADGTGNVVFYPNECVPAIVRGFFQGLDLAALMRQYPDDFRRAVQAYFAEASPSEMADLTDACFSSAMAGSKESIDFDVKQHARLLIEAFKHQANADQ